MKKTNYIQNQEITKQHFDESTTNYNRKTTTKISNMRKVLLKINKLQTKNLDMRKYSLIMT